MPKKPSRSQDDAQDADLQEENLEALNALDLDEKAKKRDDDLGAVADDEENAEDKEEEGEEDEDTEDELKLLSIMEKKVKTDDQVTMSDLGIEEEDTV